MPKVSLAVFTIAAAAIFAMMPAAKAGEIEQAHATLERIELDRVSANDEAGYFYGEMMRAQSMIQWHAWMGQVRSEQMSESGCDRPPTQGAWAQCMGLYNDLQAHARWRDYLGSVAEESKARHMAAVQRLAEIDRAGHWWHTRLAALTAGGADFATGPMLRAPIETGSIGGSRWSRVVR